MADNIDFNTATLATASMKPVGDEEVTALWARKVADNVAAVVGLWGTYIMGEVSGGAFGSFAIDITKFNEPPRLEVAMYRGGSQWVYHGLGPGWQDGAVDFGLSSWYQGGSITITYEPDSFNNIQRAFTASPGTGQAHWGTWMVRLSGW